MPHIELGARFESYNPADDQLIWSGHADTQKEIEQKVIKAKHAWMDWSRQPLEQRIAVVKRFAAFLQQKQNIFAQLIAEETGKTLWESRQEVASMNNKVVISIDAYHSRTGQHDHIRDNIMQQVSHRALGVLVVLGPYNFPGHLPNGHIVPALLAGNAILFKPSEWTPMVAEFTLNLWHEAGLPEHVLQVVYGGAAAGECLIQQELINGVLFTGSFKTGQALHRHFAGKPEKMLALEMGGNNPLIAMDIEDVDAAVYHIVQSAFITTGQRCTCARRLIIHHDKRGDDVLERLVAVIKTLKIDDYHSVPEPFMGCLIDKSVAEKMLQTQQMWQEKETKSILPLRNLEDKTAWVSPGVWDVTDCQLPDEEVFGPLLQVIRAHHFDQALDIANATQYGLAAGLLTNNERLYSSFSQSIRAGVMSYNRPTTGSSSYAPFGGIGHSGNYRPSGFYAADYCAYPVSSQTAESLKVPQQMMPGITL